MPHAAYHTLLQTAQRGTSVQQAVFRTAQHPSTAQGGMTAALQFAIDHPNLMKRIGGIDPAIETVRMLEEAGDSAFDYALQHPGILQILPFGRLYELFATLLADREEIGKKLLAFPGTTVHLTPEQRNKIFALRIPALIMLTTKEHADEAMDLKNGNRIALAQQISFVDAAGQPLPYSIGFVVMVCMHDRMDDRARSNLIVSISERALRHPQVGPVLNDLIIGDINREVEPQTLGKLSRIVGMTPWHRQLLRACSPVLPMRIPPELEQFGALIRERMRNDRNVA